MAMDGRAYSAEKSLKRRWTLRQIDWRRILSVFLCALLLTMNPGGALAIEPILDEGVSAGQEVSLDAEQTTVSEVTTLPETADDPAEDDSVDAGDVGQAASVGENTGETQSSDDSYLEADDDQSIVSDKSEATTDSDTTTADPNNPEASQETVGSADEADEEGFGAEEGTESSEGADPEDAGDDPDIEAAEGNAEGADATDEEADEVDEADGNESYTLYLTHIFRFTVDGRSSFVQADDEITLTNDDFVNGECDLNRFAQSAEQIIVTEANPVKLSDFDEDGEGGARIVYAVKDGWKVVRKDSVSTAGVVLRDVFTGASGDYKFVPANLVRISVQYKFSNTGGLAGMDAAAPEVIEVIPTEQNGSYSVTWKLPVVEGFRIVLNPGELDKFLVNPPTGSETPAQLAAKLENGDFDIDPKKGVYYAGGVSGSAYGNGYSDEYNEAWNAARVLEKDGYTAKAQGTAETQPGANALTEPKLVVTLADPTQGVDLDITVYYRRNATSYTVNHWVPEKLSGKNEADISALPENQKTTVGEEAYVLQAAETLQGRVGAMTRARAKTTKAFEQLEIISFTQKLIETSGTTVDIYYKAADSYRVIFDTDYTYIPRQQVKLGDEVDFTQVSEPKRTGYSFGGWQYLTKEAVPDSDGNYSADSYVLLDEKNPKLIINTDLIANAKLEDSGGVLALHLYPKWEPDKTNVRVILWTEDLTGTDDVQAQAVGGNTSYYSRKYASYRGAPITHEPNLEGTNPNYSNVRSFTVEVNTDSSLVEDDELLNTIQAEVTSEFEDAMGDADEIGIDSFYTQDGFQIVHEDESGIDYKTTTASADGKTMIYVYFTRNIYELIFTYYGQATAAGGVSEYCVSVQTNGYSYSNGNAINSNGTLNFAYSTEHKGFTPTWMRANVNNDGAMPVPQTITIKAKYGADLRDVWPVARSDEFVGSSDNPGGHGTTARMISWATTAGAYNRKSYENGEPTIMGTYAVMGSEIIADPAHPEIPHNLVAYWFNGGISHYRNNHCFEVPDLKLDESVVEVVLDNQPESNPQNLLYLVPKNNSTFVKYGFSDLMPVSYDGNTVTYDVVDGAYYAVRAYDGSYYAIARQVDTVSSNRIDKQNPSARLHMTRANKTPDHSTQYLDDDGAFDHNPIGTQENPYDLYFYYDRDRYNITYMAPSNSLTTETEVTLGTITLPYGALVTQEKYGFNLDYEDKNTNKKYPWKAAAEVSVCPDRAKDGKAAWTFKGWGLGPAGANMQWHAPVSSETQAQAEDSFAIDSHLRLYAIWEAPTYKVTFHLNGGSINNNPDNVVEDISANTRYSASGSIPRPVRAGYTLDGWYLSDENGNIPDDAQEFDFDEPVAINKHVAARWSTVTDKKYDYTIYYVTNKPLEADKGKDTVRIDDSGQIVTNGGNPYIVLGYEEHKNEIFVPDTTLNFAAKSFDGYVPTDTNKVLTTTAEPTDSYSVVFHYDPITPTKYTVNFVKAGTESSKNPTIIKTVEVTADQAVITPHSDIAKDLQFQGYALVNKVGNDYVVADKADDLQWIDEERNFQSIKTLQGENIPAKVIYLVQPIPYTVTYQNAAGSPSEATDALATITAAANTPVASASGKNPTQYITTDEFVVKNPTNVFENNTWYKFSHWSLGDRTAPSTLVRNGTTYTTLKVDPGTVGNLTFVANWVPLTETGTLTVAKTVAGAAGEQDREFHFTVTLPNTPINGKFGEMTFVDGVAQVALKHDESVTAGNIPAGVLYTVVETEANRDGYVTTSTGESGTITQAGVTAAFVNTKNPTPPSSKDTTGNLVVSKVVTGDLGDTEASFPFTVTLNDTTVSGSFGDMTFQNGVASFELKHGEAKSATGLPAGVHYEVAEGENADYEVIATGESGTIVAGGTATAAFNNHRDENTNQGETTSISVRKVWKLDDGGEATDSVTVTLLQDGVAYESVQLNDQNDWAYVWEDLSTDSVWTVAEANVPEGFTASVSQNGASFTITNDDNPASPSDPEDSNDPQDPDNPNDPDNPDNPSYVEDPTDPTTPDGPSDPNEPNVSNGPGPEVTANPSNPTAPTSPAGADDPVSAPEPTADVPKTGDETNLALWLALLGISGIAMIALLFGLRRKER